MGWSSPLVGSPFAQFWRAADREQAKQIRLAAAALMAEGSQAQDALPVLLEARKDSHAGAALQIDRALARCYDRCGRAADALTIIDQLLKDQGDVAELLVSKAGLLLQLKRNEELGRFLQKHLESTSLDASTKVLLACYAADMGDIPLAQKHFRKIAARGKPSAAVLNNLAWYAVVQGAVDQRALDDATKAAERTDYNNPSYLHTLATVCAEMDKPAEALENLRNAVNMRGGEIRNGDYYVLGRIAEASGLEDIAVALYHQELPPNSPSATPVSALAQRRLKKLGK